MQPSLSSPSKWLQKLTDIKDWITNQGPNTEPPQTMGATINNISTPKESPP